MVVPKDHMLLCPLTSHKYKNRKASLCPRPLNPAPTLGPRFLLYDNPTMPGFGVLERPMHDNVANPVTHDIYFNSVSISAFLM